MDTFPVNVELLSRFRTPKQQEKIISDLKCGRVDMVVGTHRLISKDVTFKDIGLVIIDEEHDISYKSDSTPRYNAKDLAKYMAEKANCPLVLGSATPDISSMYLAKENEYALYTLTKRANNANLPEVEIVDLRQELANGNRSMFSEKLKSEIESIKTEEEAEKN